MIQNSNAAYARPRENQDGLPAGNVLAVNVRRIV